MKTRYFNCENCGKKESFKTEKKFVTHVCWNSFSIELMTEINPITQQIMTQASHEAHTAAKKHMPTNEERILNFIRSLTHHGATKKELEQVLTMKHQTLTSRLSSLQDQGLIYYNPEEEPKNGCTNWYATPINLVEEYAKKQEHLKFAKWLKRGINTFGLSKLGLAIIAEEYNEKNFEG